MTTNTRHLGVAEAKAQFARIVQNAPERRTIIQRRGRDVAVVLGIDEFRRLEKAGAGATEGARVLAALVRWREATGGVEGFTAEPASVAPENPFLAAKAGRSKR